ncbi:MAG: hypothetical protein MR487_14110 [Lachnospiraceae bacterium]|nr:hypothetical protein [Lachnospiraceae bacterium]
MKYYIKETNRNDLTEKTAGVKARADAESVFEQNGLQVIEIPSIVEDRECANGLSKLKIHLDLYHLWKKELGFLSSGDWIYVQFPLVEHTILFYRVVRQLERRGIHVSVLIHDVEAVRAALRNDVSLKKRIRLKYEENSVFQECSQVIVHNVHMKKLIIDKLHVKGNKIRILGIFDYLIPGFEEKKHASDSADKNDPVIIAGNLRRHKAEYVYHLPENTTFNLYGIGYEEQNKENISYKGSFDPDELPYVLEGSFGLVWDGESAKTCTGVYGEYLKINNPHKTSLYLASGIPVIIWKEAALAEFVEKHQCGITVDSLYEISEKIGHMTDDEYVKLKSNAGKIGKQLRKGYYLIRAGIE